MQHVARVQHLLLLQIITSFHHTSLPWQPWHPYSSHGFNSQTNSFENLTGHFFKASFLFVHCFSLHVCLRPLPPCFLLHWMACWPVVPLVICNPPWTGLGALVPTVWAQAFMSPHQRVKGTSRCPNTPPVALSLSCSSCPQEWLNTIWRFGLFIINKLHHSNSACASAAAILFSPFSVLYIKRCNDLDVSSIENTTC